ncbi:MAG TPA: TIR domain-containing protein [Planctomycetota bacterium]|jgi:hypothetical protein|nr:TIR domain-containing protein [Planctomycetota bacterium]
MGLKVFLSYSRCNQYIAERLYMDLRGAGCDVFWDQRSIAIGERWRKKIAEEIQRADELLYLLSPEAEDSPYVQEERHLFRAIGKAEKVLRVGGDLQHLDADVAETQIDNLSENYWQGLRRVFAALGLDQKRIAEPDSLFERRLAMREAREILRESVPRNWTIVDSTSAAAPMRTYQRIPLLPKGYGTSWWVAEEGANVSVGEELNVALDFSGDRSDNVVRDALNFLCARCGPGQPLPQLLHIEGPINSHEQRGLDRPTYILADDKPHVWKDCIDLATILIKDYSKRRPIHLFMDAPVALVFPIAQQLKTLDSYHVYNLNRSSSGAVYKRVFSSGDLDEGE